MAGVIIFGTENPEEMYVCRSPDRHCGGGHFEKFFSDSSAFITYHRAGPHNDPEDQRQYRERAWSKTKNLVDRWYRDEVAAGRTDQAVYDCALGNCGFEGHKFTTQALMAHYVVRHPGTSHGDQAMKHMVINGMEDMVRGTRQPRNTAAVY